MARKNIKTTSLLGAATQLTQFITNHSPTLTEKGVKPDDLKMKIINCCADAQAAEQAQADARTALKNATQSLHDTVAERYPEFSSVIDLLRGAVGNHTPLGKQLTNIRKQITRRGTRAGKVSEPVELTAGMKAA